MPRTGDLLFLSQEHHTALVLARAARKVAEQDDVANAPAIIARIEAYWCDTLAAHFTKEEQLLQTESSKLDEDALARIFSDHTELEMLCRHACELDIMERLQRFAHLMQQHVRFEERVVFPQIQITRDCEETP